MNEKLPKIPQPKRLEAFSLLDIQFSWQKCIFNPL